MKIYTASWYAKLPPEIQRIGISRGTPRGMAAGYKLYRALNPGEWFRTVPLEEYVPLYNQILAQMGSSGVFNELGLLSRGADCALLCYEDARKIDKGEDFCHRHLVAQWLEDTLGVEVEEFGFPGLNRFAALERKGISRPTYR